MALPVLNKNGRAANGVGGMGPPSASSTKAQLSLALACLWPLLLWILWPSSSSSSSGSLHGSSLQSGASAPGLHLTLDSILDRVDILGYGPTHPRIGIVVTTNGASSADRMQAVKTTLESVYQYTDMNRLFVICIIVDGAMDAESKITFLQDVQEIEEGKIPHWHGENPDVHGSKKDLGDEEHSTQHGAKVRVFFNDADMGLAASRADGAEFVHILREHHELAGLKSPQEDLILVLLRAGTQLQSRHWLNPVTQALIVPPPLLSEGDTDTNVALKLANAVSFNLEGPGKLSTLDASFSRVTGEPLAADVAMSNGGSYPTPVLNGGAVAMRLDTYLNLPLQDVSIKDDWLADLDLSLNLWLCGDGIDMLRDVDAISMLESHPPAPLTAQQMARLAAAWMSPGMAKKVYSVYTQAAAEDGLTYLEWETAMAKARQDPALARSPMDLPTKKCRSFEWFVENVHTELTELLGSDGSDVNDETGHASTGSDEQNAHENLDLGEDNRMAQEVVANVVEQGEKDKVTGEKEEPLVIGAGRGADKKNPSKPLCKECLEIVQKAKAVELAFVDVSGGHQEHPHLGGKDLMGNFGYIHNATALRSNPPPFDFPNLQQACDKRDNNYRMLTEKVFVDVEAHAKAEASGLKRDKIFCLAYTTSLGHDAIPLIMQTWGPKCDGFMVGSNATDPSIMAVDIPHEGPEEYGNIWQKVRSMWSYVYDNYYEEYDWFHIGGDDYFLILENLRLYLESEEIKTAANGGVYLPDGSETSQTPLFLGRRFAYMGDMNEIFNSGGSGYTMNKAALKLLVVEGFPKYWPHLKTFSEDTMVARVFRQFNVFPYETKDDAGGERYMPFMPGHHYGYKMPSDHSKDWYAKYSINIKEGPDHCAARSVAFHYVKGNDMKRLYALLYHKCPGNLNPAA